MKEHEACPERFLRNRHRNEPEMDASQCCAEIEQQKPILSNLIEPIANLKFSERWNVTKLYNQKKSNRNIKMSEQILKIDEYILEEMCDLFRYYKNKQHYQKYLKKFVNLCVYSELPPIKFILDLFCEKYREFSIIQSIIRKEKSALHYFYPNFTRSLRRAKKFSSKRLSLEALHFDKKDFSIQAQSCAGPKESRNIKSLLNCLLRLLLKNNFTFMQFFEFLEKWKNEQALSQEMRRILLDVIKKNRFEPASLEHPINLSNLVLYPLNFEDEQHIMDVLPERFEISVVNKSFAILGWDSEKIKRYWTAYLERKIDKVQIWLPIQVKTLLELITPTTREQTIQIIEKNKNQFTHSLRINDLDFKFEEAPQKRVSLQPFPGKSKNKKQQRDNSEDQIKGRPCPKCKSRNTEEHDLTLFCMDCGFIRDLESWEQEKWGFAYSRGIKNNKNKRRRF